MEASQENKDPKKLLDLNIFMQGLMKNEQSGKNMIG